MRLLLAAVAVPACAASARRAELSNVTDARYVAAARSAKGGVVATRVYRELFARSLGSRCRMFPTDSQLFAMRARACGAGLATLFGFARLFLEVEASTALPAPFVADGRLRWLDLPVAGDCRP